MKATLVEKKKLFVMCPNCGDENSHDISSLDAGTTFGPSYCNYCGTGIRGYFDDGSVKVTEAEDRREPTFVLLRINPQDTPIYLIVRGANFIAQDDTASASNSDEEDFLDSDEFFYNHSCHPAITLQQAAAIVRFGAVNPQGIFEYIITRRAPSSALGDSSSEIPESLLTEFLPLTVQTSTNTAACANEPDPLDGRESITS